MAPLYSGMFSIQPDTDGVLAKGKSASIEFESVLIENC